MKQREDPTPKPNPRPEPLSVADLYAIYERDRAEGFPMRRPAGPTDEERWLSEDDLARPDDLSSREGTAAETTGLIDRLRGGRLPWAHFIRRFRDGTSEGRRISADDPNLGRVLAAGWVGD